MKLKIMAALAACTLSAGTAPALAQRTLGDRSVIADRTVTIHGRQVHYLRAGAGAMTIVLLHGWPQSSHEWRRVMPLLANRFTVIAPDLPGIGGSAAPEGGASAPTTAFEKVALARDIHAFVATLGAKRVVLVGHDIGGMVAYGYARLYPDELAGVAILDVPVPGVAPWDVVKTMPEAWHFNFHAQAPLAEHLVTGRQASYFRYFIDSHADNASAVSDADVTAYAAAYRSPASLHAGFGFYRAFAADAAFNAAHHEPFAVPVLLAGADHSMGPGEPQLAAGLKALGASDVRVAVIANSGHWIAEEQPVATARLIADFAAGLH